MRLAQMPVARSFTAAAALFGGLVLPAPALAAAVPTLSSNPPAWLGDRPITAPAADGSLPMTGDDLPLQLAAAAGLVGAGVALRARPRRNPRRGR